jgi:hypothetical protein
VTELLQLDEYVDMIIPEVGLLSMIIVERIAQFRQ